MFAKHILPAMLALCLSSAAFSQENSGHQHDEPGPRIGLKGGLSIATIIKTNDNNFSSTPLYGFNGGVVLQLPLCKAISLQPEILFSQKGFRSKGSSLTGDYDYRRYLNFLDIPLLLRINPSKELGFVVGPQYSYLLATHTKFTSGTASYEETVKNENDNITKNIFGGVIGLDINLNDNVFLYGRYTMDFRRNNGDGTSSTPAYRNQVIQIGLGVLF
ncbi:porin family protein [Flavitalea sp. BT771]|uniref:porin family protein n=1 Tax=Flavitalea sp. BT771 TaxID=3063329 RepID=UPI0026E20254|nr:porin family protein [Flavitalea sp. BT771]MDO6435119.1 porin family protein [Flavitalea sp. BT771]MDV6224176.1 porin family protein [Flavitalea sp. BT771]